MIQRIQTLWLALATIFNALLFFIPIYKYNFPNQVYSPWQVEKVTSFIPLFIVAAVITVLPFVAIFLFKNRSRQKSMVWISFVSILSFLSIVLMRVNNLKSGTPTPGNFQYSIPGILVTVVAAICLIMAIRGIRRDDKLVKSMDRLR